MLAVLTIAGTEGTAQTPQPFPRPAGPPTAERAPAAPAPQAQAPAAKPPAPAPAGTPPAAASAPAPTAAALGFPIFPTAQFLASYDAGRAQRYFLFGTTAPFQEVVAFYRTQLDERGDLVFKEPLTHVFEVGRFREETMAFPPGVTVKDWTFGSQGYPNPKPGGQPGRFPTVVMIVPAPPATATPPR